MKYEFIQHLIEENFSAIYTALGGNREKINELFILHNRETPQGKSFIAACCKSVFLWYAPVTFLLGLILLIVLGLLGFWSFGFYLYWFFIIYPWMMAFLSYIKECAARNSFDTEPTGTKYAHDMVNIDLLVSLGFTVVILCVVSLFG